MAKVVRSLPPDVEGILRDVGLALSDQRAKRIDVADTVKAAVEAVAQLEPRDIATWAKLITQTAELYDLGSESRRSFPGSLSKSKPTAFDQLRLIDGLEYIFIFHSDGHLREAALNKISGPLPSPFMVAAINLRANDWVWQVSHAAGRAILRTLETTPALFIARALSASIVRQTTWRRWQETQSYINEWVTRPDVASHVAHLIMQPTGPMASVFAVISRYVVIDDYLDLFSRRAAQPAVRAKSLRFLIRGAAEWSTGWQWRWIDKSMGLRERVNSYDKRPISVSIPRHELIYRGLADPAVFVRRIVLDEIMLLGLKGDEAKRFAEPLCADQNASVRVRAEFIVKNAFK